MRLTVRARLDGRLRQGLREALRAAARRAMVRQRRAEEDDQRLENLPRTSSFRSMEASGAFSFADLAVELDELPPRREHED